MMAQLEDVEREVDTIEEGDARFVTLVACLKFMFADGVGCYRLKGLLHALP